MNGAAHESAAGKLAKPPPMGPAPPAPATAPPAPPTHSCGHPAQPVGTHRHNPPQNATVNGHNHPPPSGRSKKRNEATPVDPATMYESLRNRIAALEEEEEMEEEEEKRISASPPVAVPIP